MSARAVVAKVRTDFYCVACRKFYFNTTRHTYSSTSQNVEMLFSNEKMTKKMNNETINNDKLNEKMPRYGLISTTGSGMTP